MVDGQRVKKIMCATIDFELHEFKMDFSKLLQIGRGYWNDNEAWEELSLKAKMMVSSIV